MAKRPVAKKQTPPKTPLKPSAKKHARGPGNELHQSSSIPMTTNQGTSISDDQTSLKIGPRGPIALEDFVLREKITHFDHERIPERIVHARGSGAHGYFEVYESLADITRADFLQRPGEKTPAFVRFSTVAGGAGSIDTPRDVRGFAVKLYTKEGNFDLVGNNIPVFFIQDAMKFPDVVHSVKMEPDRGFPQAASAHDTFWDFVSLTTESTHMLMWAMSDRTIPRSFRFMEGFGVHTFRLVNDANETTFVKFHWRPKLGMQSHLWDEAVKIAGADPDYHRRDLWETLAGGDTVEYELGLQLFSEEESADFPFDVLDPTKVIPEELVPLRIVGRLVLDRNPDNFFAETEQVAFCPANIVPGIDFTNDPLLQGRLFSYLDTQLIRLGGPNFHQIPINAPKCPMHNFQRDGFMQQRVPKGRVAYEPSTLEPNGEREDAARGFRTSHREEAGAMLRVRPESFADHFSHATLFWRSQTKTEQDHIVNAFVFELSKVETKEIRARMVGNLGNVDPVLAQRVAKGLRLERIPEPQTEKTREADDDPSPALSILAKAPSSIEGRVIGCVIADGFDGALFDALKSAIEKAGAKMRVIAPSVGPVERADGTKIDAEMQLDGAPSVLWDAVVIAPGKKGAADLLAKAAAGDFLRDAFGHLKVIGYTAAAEPLFERAGVADRDAGTMLLAKKGDATSFVEQAKSLRIWDREPKLRPAP
jgi:catalase